MSPSFPLTTSPHVMQRGKPSTASQLAARKPLTSLEIAHVCHALIRIANQLNEDVSTLPIVEGCSKSSIHTLFEEKDHA